MPIITIRALPQPAGVDVPAAIAQLGRALAPIFAVPEHAVFVTWQTLDPGHFAEGAAIAPIQPVGRHPPIVDVLAFAGRSEATIAQALTCIATVLPEALGCGVGNVFASYREVGPGRVWSGGGLR